MKDHEPKIYIRGRDLAKKPLTELEASKIFGFAPPYLPGPKPKSERIYTLFKGFSDQCRELLWRLEEEPRTDHPQEAQAIDDCGPESDATVKAILEIKSRFQHFLAGCQRVVQSDLGFCSCLNDMEPESAWKWFTEKEKHHGLFDREKEHLAALGKMTGGHAGNKSEV